MGEIAEVFIHYVGESLLHLWVVADKLTLRHRHLARVSAHGVTLPGLAGGSGMSADIDREITTLVVQGGIREVGGKHHGHAADDRPNRAAHRPGDDKDRTLAALVYLGGFCRHPLVAEKSLLTKILHEHGVQFHAGVAQDLVVNIPCHGRQRLVGEVAEKEAD